MLLTVIVFQVLGGCQVISFTTRDQGPETAAHQLIEGLGVGSCSTGLP